MKSIIKKALFGLTISAWSAHGNAENCRVIDSVRIDSSGQLDELQDVCEVNGSLAIFADGVEKIVLPNLKRAGLINIEAIGLRAIAMPKLQYVRDLYVSGSELEAAEFPSLLEVSSRLVIRERNIKYLNFPELRRIGRLILQSCLNLQFVFADKLYDVASARIEDNPSLNPGSASVLSAVTRKLSAEEQQYIVNSQNQILELKRQLYQNTLSQPPIRPTGHPTRFDSFGLIRSYYEWYPAEYHDYWYGIGPWGLTIYHRL